MAEPVGVILAGGQSRRMGGGDKTLEILAGRPILAHVIERLAPQTAALALNANGDAARFAVDLPVLPDPVPGHLGPLAGILAAMRWAAAERARAVVTVAGDTPFLPRDLVQRLLAARAEADPRGASPDMIAMAASEADGALAPHPTIALWPAHLADRLERDLAQGVRKVLDFARPSGLAFALIEADAAFNINTPADLARAEAMLAP